MATINVNREVQDTFYRYKMPRLVAKVEGKGNGIKTVVANMVEIAKALNRPPAYPTKFFGCELGAQTQVDKTNERYIVNGEHTADKLQDVLDGFIKRFVLCSACENPETTIKVKSKTVISQKCKACGHSSHLDMKHKLTTFIVKNPPPEDTADSSAKTGGEDHADGGILANGNGGAGVTLDEADADWEPETNDGAPEHLTERMKQLVVSDDVYKPLEERLQMLLTYVEKSIADGTVNANSGKSVLLEAERLDVREKAPVVLAQALYQPKTVLKDIATYRNVVLRFTEENKKAQRYLIGGIEQLISANEKLLMPQTPLILKSLYDEDVLDEEAILAWGAKASKKFVDRKMAQKIIDAAAKMLTWLAEAEEESDEDEEVEIEFNSGAAGMTATKVETVTNGKKAGDSDSSNDHADGNDDDDEVNIDDI